MSDVKSLKEQFADLHAERERTWPKAQLERNIAQRQALRAAFDPTNAVKAGDQVENFTLEYSQGGRVSLAELTAEGPAVVIFFRYAGCPACNIALPYYDQLLRPELDRLGVQLLAISPHLPEKGLDDIRERHKLGFRIAVDRGNALARRFGITFDRDVVPDGQPSSGWTGELTGLGTGELPQPTVLIMDHDAQVRFVNVSPDWLDRPEASEVLVAIAKIETKAAA